MEHLFVNSTDLFQQSMLDRYLDFPNECFKNGEYKVIDKPLFSEFLLLYFIEPKLIIKWLPARYFTWWTNGIKSCREQISKKFSIDVLKEKI